MKRPFTKPAILYAQQVALLRRRGMVIVEPTEFYFQHLNYSRLAPYGGGEEHRAQGHAARTTKCVICHSILLAN